MTVQILSRSSGRAGYRVETFSMPHLENSSANNSLLSEIPDSTLRNLSCCLCGEMLCNVEEGNVHICSTYQHDGKFGRGDVCFLCGEKMQNSATDGIHMCAATRGGKSGSPNRVVMVMQALPRHSEIETIRPGELENKLISIVDDVSKLLGVGVQAKESVQGAILGRLEFIRDQMLEDCRRVRLERRHVVIARVEQEEQRKDLMRRERLLHNREQELESKERTFRRQANKDREALDKEIAQLKRQKERAREAEDGGKTQVHLNVGGRVFYTSTAVLRSAHGSMLEAMFSGRHRLSESSDICTEDNKSSLPGDVEMVFLDRDPSLFEHILRYLRSGIHSAEVALPDNQSLLRLIRVEADFFLLPELVECIDRKLVCSHVGQTYPNLGYLHIPSLSPPFAPVPPPPIPSSGALSREKPFPGRGGIYRSGGYLYNHQRSFQNTRADHRYQPYSRYGGPFRSGY